MTLTEFLLARITEDEASARDQFLTSPDHHLDTVSDCDCTDDHIYSTYLAADPQRVLAQCERDRRIVDWVAPIYGYDRVPTDRPGVYNRREVRHVSDDGEDLLRIMSLPYAGHPDYQEAWKP